MLTNTSVDNVLAGDQYEFAPYRALVEFSLLGSATGLLADVLIGQRTVARALPLSVVPAANTFGRYPDDFQIRGGAFQGERVIIALRNPTGGTLTYFVIMKGTPA